MKIGFIGMGNMSAAIIGGILGKGMIEPEQIMVSRRSEDKLKEYQSQFGIHVTTDNKEVTAQSEIVVLAVKPQFLEGVIKEISPSIKENQVVVSIAAGKTIAWMIERFEKEVKLIRCMPNTPALVGEGCTGICKNELVSGEELAYVVSLFESFGTASVVAENLMDVVVGVSGSAPAYVFLFIEAMADAAVTAGMPRAQSYEFAAQAVLGSAKMVLETGKHPGELKDMVCSPAGTTIQAVRVLEEKGMRSAVIEAITACIEKSRSL